MGQNIDLGKLIQASIAQATASKPIEEAGIMDKVSDFAGDAKYALQKKLQQAAGAGPVDQAKLLASRAATKMDRGIRDASDAAKDVAGKAKAHIANAASKATELAKEHPGAAGAIAAGAGLLGAGLAARKFAKSARK